MWMSTMIKIEDEYIATNESRVNHWYTKFDKSEYKFEKKLEYKISKSHKSL